MPAAPLRLVLAGLTVVPPVVAQPADVRFEVSARRFEFDPETIQVTEGDRVTLVLRSADTTHGFALSPFGLKVKIPKGGEPVTVSFVADKAGTYLFACSKYCGAGHSKMKGRLVVTPKAP